MNINRLLDIAAQQDAHPILDREGDLAYLRRIYDGEGRTIIRHRPDPYHFRPTSWWETATEGEILVAIA